MATTDVATVDGDHADHATDHHEERIIPAASPIRHRNLQVGGAFLTAATLMYYGGLFAVYLSERASHLRVQEAAGGDVPWIPDAVRVELTAPTIMAWTLLISIVPMQWAVYSIKRNDRRHALLALLLMALFAGATINQHVFQWKQLGMVADTTSTNAPVLIYAITISFVCSMVIALIAMLVSAFRALSGAATEPYTDGVAAVAVFWYALVAIYFVIWIMVFITK